MKTPRTQQEPRDGETMSTDSISPGPPECDNEPIHIPGSIQPHGLLLEIDPLQWDIRQTSGSSDGFTGRGPGQLPRSAIVIPDVRQVAAAKVAKEIC